MDTQPTNWTGIIGSVVRFLLGSVVGGLALKGVITKEQGEFLLIEASAGAVTVIGLIWIWAKHKAEAKLAQKQIEIALDSSASKTVETVKAEAQAAVKNS